MQLKHWIAGYRHPGHALLQCASEFRSHLFVKQLWLPQCNPLQQPQIEQVHISSTRCKTLGMFVSSNLPWDVEQPPWHRALQCGARCHSAAVSLRGWVSKTWKNYIQWVHEVGCVRINVITHALHMFRHACCKILFPDSVADTGSTACTLFPHALPGLQTPCHIFQRVGANCNPYRPWPWAVA